MRERPISTGPFKFTQFSEFQYIRLVRNPDYWKKGKPYLDGIDFNIVSNPSTAVVSFIAGRFDLTFPFEVTPGDRKLINKDAPHAICERRRQESESQPAGQPAARCNRRRTASGACRRTR
jgi:peptide/nickel transport system substrate-binding protein